MHKTILGRALDSLVLALMAGRAFAQTPSPSPWNMTGIFHSVSGYQPPQYFVGSATAGTDNGWSGYEVDLKHTGAEPTNNVEENVQGQIISGTPTGNLIICERQDNVQTSVTVDGKAVSKGTVTPPDGTALYACADYSNPAGAPTPVVGLFGPCPTTAGIWAEVEAQGPPYTVGEFVAANWLATA